MPSTIDPYYLVTGLLKTKLVTALTEEGFVIKGDEEYWVAKLHTTVGVIFVSPTIYGTVEIAIPLVTLVSTTDVDSLLVLLTLNHDTNLSLSFKPTPKGNFIVSASAFLPCIEIQEEDDLQDLISLLLEDLKEISRVMSSLLAKSNNEEMEELGTGIDLDYLESMILKDLRDEDSDS